MPDQVHGILGEVMNLASDAVTHTLHRKVCVIKSGELAIPSARADACITKNPSFASSWAH